jgi:hypothetical protein
MSIAAVLVPAAVLGSFSLPTRFEENRGQFDSEIRFVSRGATTSVLLEDREVTLVDRSTPGTSVRIEWLGTLDRRPFGVSPLPGITNYLLGTDPDRWHTDIPSFERVRYEGLWPGINLVVYAHGHELEYDLELAPGADPALIQLRISGPERVKLDARGRLVVRTTRGEFKMTRPQVFQLSPRGGRREIVLSHWTLRPGGIVSVALGPYDRRRAVTIDPILQYSTYLGGSGYDVAYAVAVDGNQNAFVTGSSSSLDFAATANGPVPRLNGGTDVFIAKIDTTQSGPRSLIFSTYIGGASEDVGRGIAVDAAGDSFVTGWTKSTDFPTTPSALQRARPASREGVLTAFLTKVAPDGRSVTYSTYLGGTGELGESGAAIALDPNGVAHITGSTDSPDFPVTAQACQSSLRRGSQTSDVFVAKLDTSRSGPASLLYGTFLGGSVTEDGTGIAVDPSGKVYLTGFTSSPDFPTTSTALQTRPPNRFGSGFVTKLDTALPPPRCLLYSTYLGGNGADGDGGSAIAVDRSGFVYVTGFTTSTNFPTRNGFQPSKAGGSLVRNAFVVKLDLGQGPAGAVVYGTFLGGSTYDEGTGIGVDSQGTVYVGGWSQSIDFPGNVTTYSSQGEDAFIASIDPRASGSGSKIEILRFGGESGDAANGLAVDQAGLAYLAGATSSVHFPFEHGAQRLLGGLIPCTATDGSCAADAFLAKLDIRPVILPPPRLCKDRLGHIRRCYPPLHLSKESLTLLCDGMPCRVVDPLNVNCLTKWSNCPVCPPGTPCPGPERVDIALEDLKGWEVSLHDREGKEIPSSRANLGKTGLVLTVELGKNRSFSKLLEEGVLVFEPGPKASLAVPVEIKAQLKVPSKAQPKTGL